MSRKKDCPCCHYGYVGGPHETDCCRPEIERLSAEVAALKRRIATALSCVPSLHARENEDDSGEALFPYSRVSERTVSAVVAALAPLPARTLSKADELELMRALNRAPLPARGKRRTSEHDGGCVCRACKRAIQAAAKESGF